MPFKSEAQRKYFLYKASLPGKTGKKWKRWAKDWEAETDHSKSLPKKVEEDIIRYSKLLSYINKLTREFLK